MTTTTTTIAPYTPLESLLLFQSILKYGIDPQAFVHISAALRNNTFVQSDKSYNADRLSSESLQQLFLHLLRDELPVDASAAVPAPAAAAAAGLAAGSLSPTAKKRKLSSPPLPTLNDARAHAEKLPGLVERLYARYRDHIVTSIREDERRYEQVQGEIRILEQQAEPPRAPPAATTVTTATGEHVAAAPSPAAGPRPVDASKAPNGTPQQKPLAPSPLPAAATRPPPLAVSAQPNIPPLPTAASAPAEPKTPVSGPPLAPATPQRTPHPETPTARPTPFQHPQPDSAASLPILPQAAVSHAQIPKHPQPSHGTPATPKTKPAAPGTPAAVGTTPSASQPQQSPAAKPSHAPTTPQKSTPSQLAAQRPPSQAAVQPNQPHLAPAQGPRPPPSTPGTQKPVPAPRGAPHPTPQQLPVLQPAVSTPGSVSAAAAAATTAAQARTDAPHSTLPPVKPANISRPFHPSHPVREQEAHGPGSQRTPAAPTSAPVIPAHDNVALHSGRPLLPEHVRTPSGGSASASPMHSPRPHGPQTPAHASVAGFIPRGSGTRWKPSEPTPSTPGPDAAGFASPAYEPLSPVMDANGRFVGIESTLRHHKLGKRPFQQMTRPGHRPEAATPGTGGRPRGRPPRLSRPHTEGEAAGSSGHGSIIKKEASTPKALEDMGETTTEDGGGTVNMESVVSPGGPLGRSSHKRKREESVEFPSPDKVRQGPSAAAQARRRQLGPAVPPTHVLWMRGFPKISASALDQISSHRNANMFAHKIRDRDAPGYDSIVRHPVDLKMIRMAIMAGNKAATAAAAALSESEHQSGSSLWLPINEDLVPPRGIINSSQLESELVHMFANAIMYNPDSHRGPGPAFLRREPAKDEAAAAAAAADAAAARYQVDEDGVVNDTRGMYIEVEKLLSEMRSAEKQRGVPRPPAAARGLGLPVMEDGAEGVEGADGAGEEAREGDNDGDMDKHEADEGADTTEDEEAMDGDGGTTKRRRITRN